LYIYKLKNSKANNADTLLALECQLVKLLGITFINIQPKVMQIIVCKRMHLLPQPGNRATKPKQCFRAKAGATKLLQQAARIMKLTALLLLGACLHVHAIGFGQKISLSEREVSIEKVFQKIEAQSNYKFLYTSQVLKDARAVTITVKDASVEAVLDMICKDQPFGYRINENTVVVKPRVGVDRVIEEAGDPIDVRGVVTDADGRPLPGANVKIKGSNVGTTTDNNGRFLIKNVVENSVLEISFVGYEMKTFTVRGSGLVNVALGQKLSVLDETVVIAYGTTSRRFTTGNVATVKAVDIEKQPVQNPLLALQGRVPGIQITQLTGLNGGGVTAQIQGRNSIRSGVNPYIVVDGVPFPSELYSNGQESLVQGGSPLNYINPNDIESIDILKDADATAIYGSRAANGAILITTKKGKAGKAKLSVSMQQGWSKVTRFADMLNTRQYLDMRYEAYKNDGIALSTQTPNSMNYDLTLWDTTRYTNWQKELLGGKAQYTNINASVSGGTANIQYIIGATYNRQTTVFPGDFDDKKGSLHFNVNSVSQNQKFTVGLTGSYMYDNNHLPGVDLTNRAVLLEPDAPELYNTNGTLNWAPNVAGSSTWLNPLAFIENSDFNNETKAMVTQMSINYKLLPGLSFGSTFGFTNTLTDLYQPQRLEASRPENRASEVRYATYGIRTMSNWIIEPQLSYNFKLGNGSLNGILGTTLQKNSGHNLQVTASGFSSDQLMRSSSSAPTRRVDADASFLYKYFAVFGRLNYNWKEKYIINFTARRDGSSRFGSKSKFNSFWSMGAGWIFSEEKWIRNFGLLSFGKLRASYGTTGNDQIPDYSYIGIYFATNPNIAYQGASGLQIMNVPNPHLQWEETKKWQGGLDLGFLKDRIIMGVTYAQNLSSNQLISYSIPDVTGFSSIDRNLPAIIRNTSWEVTLHTVNVKVKELTWTTDANLTIPRNKLMKFPDIEKTSYASGFGGIILGQPLGVVKLFRYAGLDPATGKYTVFDKNDIPLVSPPASSETVFLTPLTTFYGGLSNSVTYKGWQLDILFQYVRQFGKNDFYYGQPTLYPGSFFAIGGNGNQPVTVLDRWQKPGDNATIQPYSTDFRKPRITTSSDAAYNYDASFIRLKNVSLSWQLPAVWTRKIKLQNGSVHFRGENLATFTNYNGLDPESQTIGALPPLLTWTIGINLNL
jgi:TonB-dependent starch-binding outer membrane protein SusC